MSMSSVKPTLLFILVYMTQLVDASVCFGQYGVSFPFLSFFTQTLSIKVSNINTELPMLLLPKHCKCLFVWALLPCLFFVFLSFQNLTLSFLSSASTAHTTTLVTHCSLRKPGIRNPELRLVFYSWGFHLLLRADSDFVPPTHELHVDSG